MIELLGKDVQSYGVFPALAGSSVNWSPGDLLWWDEANSTLRKASDFTWDTSEAVTRQQFARRFAGIALDGQFAESQARDVLIARAGMCLADVTSFTGIPGRLAGPEKKSASNLLEDQKFEVGFTDPSEAIALVERKYGAATTKMQLSFLSRIQGVLAALKTMQKLSKVINVGTITSAADRLTNMDAMQFFGGPAEVLALGFHETTAITTKPLKVNLEKDTTDLATLTVPVTGAAIGRYTEASMAADANRIFQANDTISIEIAATAPSAGAGNVIVVYRPLN